MFAAAPSGGALLGSDKDAYRAVYNWLYSELFIQQHVGVVTFSSKKCEDCKLKQSNFGLPAEGTKRWCGTCAKQHVGAVNVSKKKRTPPHA